MAHCYRDGRKQASVLATVLVILHTDALAISKSDRVANWPAIGTGMLKFLPLSLSTKLFATPNPKEPS
jgi:hypothetical protein